VCLTAVSGLSRSKSGLLFIRRFGKRDPVTKYLGQRESRSCQRRAQAYRRCGQTSTAVERDLAKTWPRHTLASPEVERQPDENFGGRTAGMHTLLSIWRKKASSRNAATEVSYSVFFEELSSMSTSRNVSITAHH
jgi:hypothetical protein